MKLYNNKCFKFAAATAPHCPPDSLPVGSQGNICFSNPVDTFNAEAKCPEHPEMSKRRQYMRMADSSGKTDSDGKPETLCIRFLPKNGEGGIENKCDDNEMLLPGSPKLITCMAYAVAKLDKEKCGSEFNMADQSK